MNAIETIRGALAMSKGFAEALLRDMQSDQFARPGQDEGHHAYWILGHLVYSEAQVLDRYLLDKPNRHEKLASLFRLGSSPCADAGDGPSYAELLEELDIVRAATLEHVSRLTETDLDKACFKAEDGPTFQSVGECLLGLALHTGIHAGQIADARRAAGRKPLFF